MIDPFVLLTPIILLLVVALLQFIGCSFSAGTSGRPAAPTLTPPGGTFGGPLSVTLSSLTPDVTFFYTTDGSEPTDPPTPSTQDYVGPIVVSTSPTTIRAFAKSPGGDYSDEGSGTYTIVPIAEVPGRRAKGQVDDGVSATVAFPGPVTLDNLLVVAGGLWRDNGGTTIATIQDTLGTSYGLFEFVSTGDPNYHVFIAYGRAPASGPNSVTVTAAAAAYSSFGIDEFTGIFPNAQLNTDGGGLSGGPSTTPSAPITPGIANTLIVGTMTFESPLLNTFTITPGAGYTQIAEEEDNNHTPFNAEFKIVTTPGTQTVDWTLGTSFPWTLYRVAFLGWPTE